MEQASTEFGGLATGAEIKTADLPTLIGKIISIILGLLGVVLILLIIYSGFLWMTAGGEPKQVDKAQAYIKNAVIGLVVILLAYAITQFVIDKLMLVSTGQ
jgi:Na+-driven multidrug efflux pump